MKRIGKTVNSVRYCMTSNGKISAVVADYTSRDVFKGCLTNRASIYTLKQFHYMSWSDESISMFPTVVTLNGY